MHRGRSRGVRRTPSCAHRRSAAIRWVEGLVRDGRRPQIRKDRRGDHRRRSCKMRCLRRGRFDESDARSPVPLVDPITLRPRAEPPAVAPRPGAPRVRANPRARSCPKIAPLHDTHRHSECAPIREARRHFEVGPRRDSRRMCSEGHVVELDVLVRPRDHWGSHGRCLRRAP